MNMLTILATILLPWPVPLSPQDSSKKSAEPATRTFFEYRDSAKGMTLTMTDGRVELVVPSADPKKTGQTITYRAPSMEEFQKLYPGIAKQYDLEHCLPKGASPRQAEDWWSDWTARFLHEKNDLYEKYFRDLPKDAPDALQQLDRWFEDEHERLRDFERRLHADGMLPQSPEPAKGPAPLFGVLVIPLGDTLRSQLGLKPHEGLVVADVTRSSLAEECGVKPHDVLLKIGGASVEDTGNFREQISAARQKKEAVLEVIRGGKILTLSLHTAHS